MAPYAQACNLFAGPDLGRKLEVLRAHCDAEGRSFDETEKTCYFTFDFGDFSERGERATEVADQLAGLAGMGFRHGDRSRRRGLEPPAA